MLPAEIKEAEACLAVAGKTDDEIAAELGISNTTVKKHLKQRDVVARVKTLRSEIVEQVLERLTTVAGHAVSTLRGLLDDEDPKIRMEAAKLVLSNVLQFQKLEETRDVVAKAAEQLGTDGSKMVLDLTKISEETRMVLIRETAFIQ